MQSAKVYRAMKLRRPLILNNNRLVKTCTFV